MDMPPATQGRRVSSVVDRNLDELCACLDGALSSRQRSPYAEERLRESIEGKTVFLRSLLAAEAECQGGARPVHLAEAEARFAVLEAAFDRWARRAVVAAPEPVEEEEVVVGEPEEEEEEADCSGSSRSTCSCTDSCQEATEGDAKREDVVEARDEEGASDVIADAEGETAETRREQATDAVAKKRGAMGTSEEVTQDAIAKKRDTDREAAAETGRRAVQRRWWRRSAAAWCGAACVVAVVAVGLAVGLAAVAHPNVNVYVVPT